MRADHHVRDRPERQRWRSNLAIRTIEQLASRCVVTWAILVMTTVTRARADHHEAQWSVRPLGGVAELQEAGAPAQPAMVGGLALGFSYGVSNRLDIGGQVIGLATTAPRFMETAIVDGGAPYTGPLARRTESALLLLGPTWRFGVSWIPVVAVAAGGGARHRSDGTLTDKGITLDDKHALTVFDLAATVGFGLEHRVNARLVVGAYASALASWGPSAPLMPTASVSLGFSYVHYPLWW